MQESAKIFMPRKPCS